MSLEEGVQLVGRFPGKACSGCCSRLTLGRGKSCPQKDLEKSRTSVRWDWAAVTLPRLADNLDTTSERGDPCAETPPSVLWLRSPLSPGLTQVGREALATGPCAPHADPFTACAGIPAPPPLFHA